MKHKILLLMLCCFMPCQIFAESAANSQQIAERILKKFMAIEKQTIDYKKKTFILNKNIITALYQGNVIKKIIIETENEIGTTQDNFYLDNNELILCRSITSNMSLGADGKLSKAKKSDKQYLLYQAGELVKPSSNLQINQKYLDLGIAKRNLLIETLAKAFIADSNQIESAI